VSLPSIQEDSVREVVGENGEYMAGPLVQKSDISGDSYLKVMFEVKVDSDVVVNPTEDYLHTTFRNKKTIVDTVLIFLTKSENYQEITRFYYFKE
jgi:hypothetical protein